MLISSFYKKLGEKKDWVFGKTFAEGYEETFYIRVFQEGIQRRIVIFFRYNDGLNKYRDKLVKQTKKLGVKEVLFFDQGVVLVPNEFLRVLNIKKLQNILDFFINQLTHLDCVFPIKNEEIIR